MRREDVVSREIIAAAIEVHRHLGPGLLESAYEQCLCHELASRRLDFSRQVPLPLRYKGRRMGVGYRLDVVVEGVVIVEIKVVRAIEPIHLAQVLTYLKLSNLALGMILNFGEARLKDLSGES